MRKFIKIIVNISLVIAIVFSIYKILLKLNSYRDDSITYKKIVEKYEPTIDNSKSTKEKYNILKQQNEEYKLWISVENTFISYPVVQGADNQFYLTHDFNKNKSSSGCIFIDYQNNIEEDRNIVVYGHNMRNKTMFNSIEKYKDKDFFSKNNNIIITTDIEEKIYEVFSVYVVKDTKEYIKTNFENEKSYEEYIRIIQSKSMYKTEQNITPEDKILTLYTCSYEYKDARTIVHARLVSLN